MKLIFIQIAALLSIILMIAACNPFLPVKRTFPVSELPPTYSNLVTETSPRQRWWEEFGDQQLNILIKEALGNNLTLKEVWARLRQSEALAGIIGAAIYPDFSAEINTSSGRRRTANGQTKTESVKQHAVGLLSSYELDLWGRIRSEREAALLSVSATREDINSATISLTAAVTERWVRIISQRMQKHLLKKQLKFNITLLELIELRFSKSSASALNVFQQRQVVERSRSQIPLVEQSERLLLNELALLLGRFPQSAPDIERKTVDIPSHVPTTGLPVQLLNFRPDIRAAFLRLQAADRQVAAACANRLPGIRLTANAAYQAGELNILLNNWLLNLAANLTAPLFDGGKRKADVERTRAVADENLSAYRHTVLNAVKEVEDALVTEEKLRRHINGLKAQLCAAQSSMNEARQRYFKGLNDYLTVLTELLTVQNLEINLIQRKADLLVARVNLYRALGGTCIEY